ncbi:MAG: T9SS type A sorting domain-containing protein [Bacteroidia bacterium]|nr:T9SS type A sorting domain-containing protein [Bacteroidia bacterium]MDW8347528.1 T9SS type A sorting domain-containing protein [Bacteroidia bacterium]
MNVNTLRSQSSITVVTPNGGETWYSFSSQTIQWIFTGTPPIVDIYLSTDNMVSWNVIASGVASGSMGGSHTITVPYVNSNKCFVRIINASAPSIRDSSNNAFTIIPPSITVTAPNGGETWNIGSLYNITWTTIGPVSSVDIMETRDNAASWNIIQVNVPNGVGGGSYSWLIGGSPSTQCKVRVTDFMIPLVGDTSNSTFTIMAPMNISSTNNWLSEPLKAYPNPAVEHVTVEIPSGTYQLTLNDMLGKTITQSSVIVNGGVITFNISNVPQGMYILRLQDANNKVYLQKIEKM